MKVNIKNTFLILLSVVLLFTSCAEKPAEEVVAQPVEKRVSFVGCGDNIIYVGNIRDAENWAVEGGRKYNFKPTFDEVAEKIKGADISFINQETLMCGEGYDISFYPCFNSPQDLGYDLVELGFDVVGIANNHMLDKGSAGLYETIKFWKKQDCLMIGGYENQTDYAIPRILSKNGIDIAFLSYTYATNGITKNPTSPLIIPYIEDEVIKSQVAAAKEVSDFVMVMIHWGNEDQFMYSDEQKRVGQIIADAGADAIIGHHPHVIQPIEWLTGVNGNKTLCVYSLGNFAAEQAYQYNMVGGMIEFDIVKIDNEKAVIETPVFNPTVLHYRRDLGGNKIYYLKDYTRDLASVHAVKTFFGNKFDYDTLFGYVYDTIPPEFLPAEYKKPLS